MNDCILPLVLFGPVIIGIIIAIGYSVRCHLRGDLAE